MPTLVRALVEVQHARACRSLRGVRDFAFMQLSKRSFLMITFRRSASVAPGMFSSAMAFAIEITAQVKAITGVNLQIAVPVGGNASRIAWIANYENLAEYEAVGKKLLGDQKYQELVKKAAGIFVPDTLHDEIWRTL